MGHILDSGQFNIGNMLINELFADEKIFRENKSFFSQIETMPDWMVCLYLDKTTSIDVINEFKSGVFVERVMSAISETGISLRTKSKIMKPIIDTIRNLWE